MTTLATIALLLSGVGALAAGPLTVATRVRPVQAFVGQSVELDVAVVGKGDEPEVSVPRIAGVEVAFAGKERRPIFVSAIGDAVREQAVFRYHYRLLPRRAGSFTVPAVVAMLGSRRGISDPVRFQVRDVPREGRPADFLGGVGRFDVVARAAPVSLRVGQPLTYRLTVAGPGSRGIRTAPSLDRFVRLPLGLRIERLPDEVVSEPPAHTFVYRLRPTQPGEAKLPPVSVTAFEPSTGRFETKATSGLTVRVAHVPSFNEGHLRYRSPDAASASAATRLLRRVGLGSVVLVTLARLVILAGRRWNEPTRRSRRLLARLGRDLAARAAGAETARRFADGLVAYLAVVNGRPTGVLTPAEAEDGVWRATGSAELSARARDLMSRADRLRFEGGTGTGDDPGLAGDARAFLRALAGETSKRIERQATASSRGRNTASQGPASGGFGRVQNEECEPLVE